MTPIQKAPTSIAKDIEALRAAVKRGTDGWACETGIDRISRLLAHVEGMEKTLSETVYALDRLQIGVLWDENPEWFESVRDGGRRMLAQHQSDSDSERSELPSEGREG